LTLNPHSSIFLLLLLTLKQKIKIMKIKFFAVCLIFTIIFILPSQMSFAKEEPLGSFTSISGFVHVQRAKETEWIKAEQNMSVYFGDKIKSGDDGEGEITFNDQSLLKIHQNAHIAINTIISPVEKRNSIILFFGRIWSRISKEALRRKAFEVQTPTAVCGARGTEFSTAVYEDGTMLVRVDSGRVNVDNETNQSTLASNQGSQLSFITNEIKTESDFQPDWEQARKKGRQNLFADGEKYGGFVHSEIHKRRDQLKSLVDKAGGLSEEKERYLSSAKEARKRGDDLAYEENISKVTKINIEIMELNRKIAFSGRRLECHFGLFSHYGYLAKHPELSKKFHGKEFILKELDNIEMIEAEFNAMIEEGMKMSMEDMEDLMDDMRLKMKKFRESNVKKDPFDEMDKDFE
jgi:hypothetical protein